MEPVFNLSPGKLLSGSTDVGLEGSGSRIPFEPLDGIGQRIRVSRGNQVPALPLRDDLGEPSHIAHHDRLEEARGTTPLWVASR